MLSGVQPIIERLASDVADVWELTLDGRVWIDPPRLPETSAPFAVITLQEVARSASGARHSDETLRFEITGVFPILDDERALLMTKLAKARALGDRLTPEAVETGGIMPTGGRYADTGWGAFIPNVSFVERYELTEPVFTVTITFEVTTTVLE